MEVVKGLHNAGGVEARGSVVEVAAIPQDGPQFTAQTTLHQHVEIFAIFEGFEQFHDEVRVGLEAEREGKGMVSADGEICEGWWRWLTGHGKQIRMNGKVPLDSILF